MPCAPSAGISWSAVCSTTSGTLTASVRVEARCIRWYSTVARLGPEAATDRAGNASVSWLPGRMRTLSPVASGYSSKVSHVSGGRSTVKACGLRLTSAAR
ncbi:hypothetical protein [Streptomyces sp. NRRL F-5635]|uniref:hypothetical protein n=1 Tax=Streptomyces sp. NRRL F-5635 TaxID=1463865 RepID=UPI002D21EB4C|nr:hypothetical protein [Streptomyces sp. NRRL F-5635]